MKDRSIRLAVNRNVQCSMTPANAAKLPKGRSEAVGPACVCCLAAPLAPCCFIHFPFASVGEEAHGKTGTSDTALSRGDGRGQWNSVSAKRETVGVSSAFVERISRLETLCVLRVCSRGLLCPGRTGSLPAGIRTHQGRRTRRARRVHGTASSLKKL
ncbi:hypothetical protein AAFF_G00125210 [Aldrovandia affinis]|uniref:Uncharacterized protein n=1 Tax=Aldrovandia affinis TaxID=143900 RepID=A0AAD7RRK4_9TELE|nr:hypothetical protein AAFF_G00125210 [Aldrovandia affinis]